MKKPEFRIIKKQTWQMLTSDTLWNVWSLLDATRTLVYSSMEKTEGGFGDGLDEDSPSVAAGLYSHAVEEFGKYLYLKSIEPIDGEYHINYSDEFLNHRKKFERALSHLPRECTLVHLGKISDDEPFYDLDFQTDIIADFETRKRIFYSDLDPRFLNKITQQPPPVSAKLLKIGIQKLWEIADSEHTKLMDKKQSNSKNTSS